MNPTGQADTVWFSARGQVVIPQGIRKPFGIEGGTRAVLIATDEGILVKPVTAAQVKRGRGIVKRKPDDKPFNQSWSEHKTEEKALEEARNARHGSR